KVPLNNLANLLPDFFGDEPRSFALPNRAFILNAYPNPDLALFLQLTLQAFRILDYPANRELKKVFSGLRQGIIRIVPPVLPKTAQDRDIAVAQVSRLIGRQIFIQWLLDLPWGVIRLPTVEKVVGQEPCDGIPKHCNKLIIGPMVFISA